MAAIHLLWNYTTALLTLELRLHKHTGLLYFEGEDDKLREQILLMFVGHDSHYSFTLRLLLRSWSGF